MNISKEKMAAFKATAQRRSENEKEQLARRYQRAWELARKGADLLKKQFKAKEVKVFGSLVRKELFHIRSDVDLAVRGLNETEYYRAVSRLQSLDNEIKTDLIMTEDIQDSLRICIEKEGISL